MTISSIPILSTVSVSNYLLDPCPCHHPVSEPEQRPCPVFAFHVSSMSVHLWPLHNALYELGHVGFHQSI